VLIQGVVVGGEQGIAFRSLASFKVRLPVTGRIDQRIQHDGALALALLELATHMNSLSA
jgi:hypothetical protein